MFIASYGLPKDIENMELKTFDHSVLIQMFLSKSHSRLKTYTVDTILCHVRNTRKNCKQKDSLTMGDVL